MLQKLLVLLCAAMLCTDMTYCQTPPPPTLTLPDQVPPPADAAALGKYGDVPLNMSSGVPSISIPFYVIKTRKLSVPITLNYDASGIKVSQIASWVGLQWSLDAGGVITRTVNGGDDLVNGYYQDSIPPIANTYQENNVNSWNYLEGISTHKIDSKPDYFFYNFSGHSGQFIFGENKLPIDLHHQEPLQINYTLINGVNTFNILDGVGNQYIFAANQNDRNTFADGTSTGYVSSWYLSQIISDDKTDTVSFNYYSDNPLTETTLNYNVTINDFLPTPALITQGISGQTGVVSNPLRLQSITFKNGKAMFYSSGPRMDVPENKLDSIVINRYDFKSKTYLPFKTLKLNYGYYKSKFPSADTSYRLRLDSVRIKGGSGENGGKYSFTYNQNPLPLIHSLGRDLFNYYNGKDINTTLVPNTAIPAVTVNQLNLQLADRNTYDAYLESGILTRVYYPTTGYTEFTYEPNKYKLSKPGTKNNVVIASCGNESHHAETNFTPTINVTADIYFNISAYAGGPMTYGKLLQGTTQIATVFVDPHTGANQHQAIALTAGVQYTLVADAQANSTRTTSAYVSASWSSPDTTIQSLSGGGLRTAAVKNYDNAGNYLNGQMYKYGNGEDGFGRMPAGSVFLNTFNKETKSYWGEYQTPSNPGGFGICIQHHYTYDVYTSSSIYDIFNLSSQAISYPQVSKYQIDQSGNFLGKTIYNYSVYTTTTDQASFPFATFDVVNSGYKGGTLLSQIDYSYANGIYIPVKKVFFRYDSIPGPSGRSFRAERQYLMSGCFTNGYGGDIIHYFLDFPINSGSVLSASQTTYDYNMGDTTKFVVSTRSLAYDNAANLQPITTTEDMSDGTSLVTTDLYPEEKTSIANLSPTQSAAIDQLVQMHNLTTLIQKTVKRANLSVSVLKNDYKIWRTNEVYQDTVEAQNFNYPIENRLFFLGYDNNGNILQDARAGGVLQSYLWDYNNQYAIAEVKNASPTDIAYTSFEADGTGNWTIASAARDLTTPSLTGLKSYNLSSGNVIKSGLTAGTAYVVSYWTRNVSPYTITGTITGFPIKGITLNGWTYYEHKVTGQTTITLSGTGNIDELRLYPQNAQMTSYTYTPLVGVTTISDAKDEINYYEYDGLGRLVDIKNQNGNVVKSFTYHYTGQ